MNHPFMKYCFVQEIWKTIIDYYHIPVNCDISLLIGLIINGSMKRFITSYTIIYEEVLCYCLVYMVSQE